MRDGPRAAVATAYVGPVSSVSVEVAGRPVVLVRPTEPDRLLDDPGVHRE